MGLEIPGINAGVAQDYRIPNTEHAPVTRTTTRRVEGYNEVELKRSLELLEQASSLFNKRLKFSVNREINRVVVKVVDGTTDKIIKEIPPEEIQRLLARIKEMIGLVVDEKI